MRKHFWIILNVYLFVGWWGDFVDGLDLQEQTKEDRVPQSFASTRFLVLAICFTSTWQQSACQQNYIFADLMVHLLSLIVCRHRWLSNTTLGLAVWFQRIIIMLILSSNRFCFYLVEMKSFKGFLMCWLPVI